MSPRAPGPIYSGIPINANADPLTLDSGRAVTGGYSVSNGSFTEGDAGCGCEVVDCGCEVSMPVDACGDAIMSVPVDTVIDEGCGCGPVYTEGTVPMGAIEGPIVEPVGQESVDGFFEGASNEEEQGDPVEQSEDDVAETKDPDHVPVSSFLKRFSSWIVPTNDIKS